MLPGKAKINPIDRESKILVPSRRSRTTFLFGLVLVPLSSTVFGGIVLYRARHVNLVLLFLLFGYVLFISRSILNQLTLKVELSKTALAAESLFRTRRKLALADINDVKMVGGLGRQGIKLLPKDNRQQPLSFAIDVLSAADRALILQALSDAKR